MPPGEAFDKVAAMLGLLIPAARPSRKLPKAAIAAGLQSCRALPRRGRSPRFQLQRAEDGGPLSHCRSRAARLLPDQAAAAASRRPGGQLSGSGRQRLAGQDVCRLAADRMRKLCVGGGVAANARFRAQITGRGGRPRRAAAHRPLAALHRQRRDGRHRHRALQGRPYRGPKPRGLPGIGGKVPGLSATSTR